MSRLIKSSGDSAFKDNRLTGVTGVVIPDSVTRIGPSAYNGDQLTSVTLPANVALSKNSFYKTVRKSRVNAKIIAYILYPLMFLNRPPTYHEAFDYYSENVSIGLVEFYNRNGKKAGIYTRDGKKWRYEPSIGLVALYNQNGRRAGTYTSKDGKSWSFSPR